MYFRYTGRTSLTAVGPRTGKRYRFGYAGAVVPVDPRDRRALKAIANLQQVRRA